MIFVKPLESIDQVRGYFPAFLRALSQTTKLVEGYPPDARRLLDPEHLQDHQHPIFLRWNTMAHLNDQLIYNFLALGCCLLNRLRRDLPWNIEVQF